MNALLLLCALAAADAPVRVVKDIPPEDDPAAARVVEFVRAVSGVPSAVRH